MKQFARSVPVILFLSVASLSLIALAGCGASGSSNSGSGNSSGPMAAKNIYTIQNSFNETTEIEQDSVLVFSASSTGSTTPTSTLMLPSNFEGDALAVGPQGQIYVGGIQFDGNVIVSGQILEYPAGSSGSATPTVTLNGSSAGTATFTYPNALAVNSAGTLFVSSLDGSLEAFASGFTASSAPTQYLTWVMTNFGGQGGPIGADTAGDIFYLDSGIGASYGAIYMFAAGATGATVPVRMITGTNTASFSDPINIAVDGAGDVYVANYNQLDDPNAPPPESNGASKRLRARGPERARPSIAYPHTTTPPLEPTGIIEFAAGATGAATPMKRIGGAGAATNATNIVEPYGLALDAASNLYYADANGGYVTRDNPLLLEVFPSSATGNVAPAASLTSPSYTLFDFFNFGEVAVF
jgi:hypothetical protein